MSLETSNPAPTRREFWIAVILAAACSALFLGQGLLPTRSILPFAPEVYEPAHSQALLDGDPSPAELAIGNRSMGDKFNQSLAWDRILQTRLRAGEIPVWTRDIAGGAPCVPLLAPAYQPWNLLLLIPGLPSVGAYGIWYWLHQILFGVSAWWLLRKLGLSQQAALFGLVCAVLGFWTQARIHHNVMLTAALPVFWLLGLVHDSVFRGFTWSRFAAIALGTGLSWLGGFAPASLQISYLVVAYTGFCCIRVRRIRPGLVVGGALALGGMLSLAQMVPALLAAAVSAREAASATALAADGLSSIHLATSVWPELLAWPDQFELRPTWNALAYLPDHNARTFNHPETAFSLGLPATLLMLCAALDRRPAVWFFAGVAAIAFGIATAASPFLELTAALPGARAGDLRRFLFLVAVGTTVVAAYGADRISRTASRPHALLVLGCIAVIGCAWPLLDHWLHSDDVASYARFYAAKIDIAVGGTPIPFDQKVAYLEAAPEECRLNSTRNLWSFGRATGLALAVLLIAWRARPTLRIPFLMALTAAELLVAGHGTIVPIEADRVTALPKVLQPVMEATRSAERGVRPRFQRLEVGGGLDLLPPNLIAFHGIEDLGAYNPLPSARMEQLFTAIEPDRPGKRPISFSGAGVGPLRAPETLQHPLLDLLGVRFVVADVAGLATDDTVINRTPVDIPAPFRCYERTTTWPRATFVDHAEVVADSADRLARLGSTSHDARRIVLLEDPAALALESDGRVELQSLEILNHEDERVAIRVHNLEPGYLRLADPYDAGWTASVDGISVPVLVADHYVRAVYLDAGEHLVTFAYDSLRVQAPRHASLAALLMILAVGLLGIRRRPPVNS